MFSALVNKKKYIINNNNKQNIYVLQLQEQDGPLRDHFQEMGQNINSKLLKYFDKEKLLKYSVLVNNFHTQIFIKKKYNFLLLKNKYESCFCIITIGFFHIRPNCE